MRTDRRSPDVWPSVDLSTVRQAKVKELLVRFLLGAGVSICASIISAAVDARFGGVFLAFPAILPASLTFLQEKEGTRKADRDAIGAVLGGLALVVYAATAESTFTRLHPALALLCSLGAWVIASSVMYAILAAIRPDDCDRRKD